LNVTSVLSAAFTTAKFMPFNFWILAVGAVNFVRSWKRATRFCGCLGVDVRWDEGFVENETLTSLPQLQKYLRNIRLHFDSAYSDQHHILTRTHVCSNNDMRRNAVWQRSNRSSLFRYSLLDLLPKLALTLYWWPQNHIILLNILPKQQTCPLFLLHYVMVNEKLRARLLHTECIKRAQVKVGLINLCKGLFSLNVHEE
jgi:hypothetical protein